MEANKPKSLPKPAHDLEKRAESETQKVNSTAVVFKRKDIDDAPWPMFEASTLMRYDPLAARVELSVEGAGLSKDSAS